MALIQKYWTVPALGFCLFFTIKMQCAIVDLIEGDPPWTLSEALIASNQPDIPGTEVERDADPFLIDLERPIYVKARMPHYNDDDSFSDLDPWVSVGLFVKQEPEAARLLIVRYFDMHKEAHQVVTFKFYEPYGKPLEHLTADDEYIFRTAKEIVKLQPGNQYRGYISLQKSRMHSPSERHSYEIIFSFGEKTLAHARAVLDLEEDLKAAEQAARFAERRPPGELLTDARLKKQIIAINRSYFVQGTAQNVRVISDWDVIRNERTGILLGRHRWISISYKRDDGTCYFVSGVYRQDHDGETYGKTYLRVGWDKHSAGEFRELDCSNV